MPLFILISSVIVCVIYIILFFFYRKNWRKTPEFSTEKKIADTFISVIIAARNEEENIPALLEALDNQSYPRSLFEIIIIDDHSSDGTAALIQKSESGHIKLITLKDHLVGNINSYKKKAIETGINFSRGDLIVTTDADCFFGPEWLSTISSYYEKYGSAFIAAPVNISCGNSFIQIFQALDFMTMQGITGSAISGKFHNMCNGANMAFERSAYDDAGGFNGIDKIASGDDMLLMHKIAALHPERIGYLKSKNAVAHTLPVYSIKEFFSQRIRWASKSGYYKDQNLTRVLIVVYLFNLLLLALPVLAIWKNHLYAFAGVSISLIQVWLLMLLFKIIAEICFLFPVAVFFKKRKLLFLFPLLQPFHILYIVIAGFLGVTGSYTWKERIVR